MRIENSGRIVGCGGMIGDISVSGLPATFFIDMDCVGPYYPSFNKNKDRF